MRQPSDGAECRRAYGLAAIDAAALDVCVDVAERYRDQVIGAADASLVVLADRYATRRILTLDRRHFAVLRPLDGARFSIVGVERRRDATRRRHPRSRGPGRHRRGAPG